MKQVNAYYRKNGTAKGFEDISDEQAAKLMKLYERDIRLKNSLSLHMN